MLSVNYLATFLSNRQKPIEESFYDDIQLFEKNKLFERKPLTQLPEILNSKSDRKEDYKKDDFKKDDSMNHNREKSFSKSFEEKNLRKEYKTDDVENINFQSKQVSFEMDTEEVNVSNIENILSPLYDCFSVLFGKKEKLYIDDKQYKNKSFIFSLFQSVLGISDTTFLELSEDEKTVRVKEAIKKMDNDFVEKQLYEKYNYNLLYNKLTKKRLNYILKMAVQWKHTVEDKDDPRNQNKILLQCIYQYISDYFGVHIMIFHISCKMIQFDRCETYLTTRFGKKVQKFVPTMFLVYEDEKIKPIIRDHDNSLFLLSTHKDLINNVWKHLKVYDYAKSLEDLLGSNYEVVVEEKTNQAIVEPQTKTFFKEEIKEQTKEEQEQTKEEQEQTKQEQTKQEQEQTKQKQNIIVENILENPQKQDLDNELEKITKPEKITEPNKQLDESSSYKRVDLEKMVVQQLKDICKGLSISVTKKSETTQKWIGKTKGELVEDIISYKKSD